MSIIERAAKLLGSIERPDSTPSTSGERDGLRKADVITRTFSESDQRSGVPEAGTLFSQLDEAIERAIAESTDRSGLIEPQELIAQPEGNGLATESRTEPKPASPIGRTRRILRINPDQLRRQQILTSDGERTSVAESFRRIKRQILARADAPRIDAPANLVLVTSALVGEGKTYCAINLAISIALEIDRTVLLVDADVANPRIQRTLGLTAEHGLMDVLCDPRIALEDVLWNTDIGKLTLLPAGKAHKHSTELLASEAMGALLHEMAERYQDRIVIFDSPPLLAASEADALASQMGQIVIVVEAANTSETALMAALGRIDSSKVTGLLLNKAQFPGQGYDYGGYG